MTAEAGTSDKAWTVRDVLLWSEEFLRRKGIPAARTDAEILLMDILNLQRTDLYLQHTRILGKTERDAYRAALVRRGKKEPVQYVSGSAYFMGKRFIVNPAVLIPRFDTETLVTTVQQAMAHFKDKPVTIIDVGAGSGILAITLAQYFSQSSVIALDISPEALAVARQNAELHGVSERIEFKQSDILTALIHYQSPNPVILVSNPPYISPTEYSTLSAEVRCFEPKIALSADDPEGVYYYKQIISQAALLGDVLAGIFLEVGYRQAGLVHAMVFQRWHHQVSTARDVGGIERVVYTVF
jgi:release factor glutamine methyltransferase